MLFLVNGRKTKRKGARVARRRKSRKGKMPAALAAYWAGKRKRKSTSTKRKRTMARKRKRSTKRRRRSVAVAPRRRRRSVARRSRPVRRRRSVARRARRRYRRNPGFGFSTRGILGTIKEGAMGAVGVFAGQVIARKIVAAIPGGEGSMVAKLGKQLLAAVAVGFIGKKAAPRLASYAIAGAMSDIITPLVSQLPGVSSVLGDDSYLGYGNTPGSYLGAYAGGRGLGAYAGGFSAYPALVGISGDEGE